MSIIRCEYCGMAYDGGRNENCPHCNAPRPQTSPDREPVASIAAAFTPSERRELADGGVTRFYADDVPYYVSSNDGCGIESDVAEYATPIDESGGLMSDAHEEPRVIDSNDDFLWVLAYLSHYGFTSRSFF